MRLFFALWPDAATRAQLEHWAREMHALCGGRRTRTDRLHLTLAFLGEVDAVQAAEVERAADAVLARPLVLRIDEPGYWKRNRIAWAGVSAPPPELHELVSGLRGALQRANIVFDPKPFVSHVTLAREARAPDVLPALPPIDWRVRDFALVESAPAGRGTEYRIRRVLGGREAG